jgi:hypothetical protein
MRMDVVMIWIGVVAGRAGDRPVVDDLALVHHDRAADQRLQRAELVRH